MLKSKVIKIFLTLFILFLVSFFVYFKFFKKTETQNTSETQTNEEVNSNEEVNYSSNIIKDVEYATTDADGNEYVINAIQGEIDFTNSNILYLTKVNALITLNDLTTITITSDYGKYNTDNFDTIFSKNVIIKYLENKILGEYLDFSIERNSMIISRNVKYTNLENILKADVIEINLKTKDTKIFMYENEKKVNVRSK
tara:strand:+ start:8 stop:601 length:594 start_codon:yes stop_codon:yes gene_type:complete